MTTLHINCPNSPTKDIDCKIGLEYFFCCLQETHLNTNLNSKDEKGHSKQRELKNKEVLTTLIPDKTDFQ